MRYLTVCSGVDAVSLAWEPLGFKPVAFSEIESFPKAVLKHHWPDVPDLGDLTKIDGRDWKGEVDILWGSTPCQAFSFAGLRGGTTDPRGALSLAFCKLADDIDPDFVCWENVKGVFSDKGNAFGHLLGALAGESQPLVAPGGKWSHAGYVLGPRRRIAWRLFDAQYSGVPQRRSRLFLVGCPTGGADPREILFEQVSGGQTDRPSGTPREGHVSPLAASSHGRAFSVAFRGRENGEECEVGDQVSNCLRAATGGSDKAYALVDDGVRPSIRLLTPLECERLMGFPDQRINIRCYLDHQKNLVRAEIQNHKSRKFVENVEPGKLFPHAINVANNSSTPQAEFVRHAGLVAHVNLDNGTARMRRHHNAPKPSFDANGASQSEWSLLPEQADAFARLLVHMNQTAARIIQTGVAESVANETCFSDHGNGSSIVPLSGRETNENVNGAEKNTYPEQKCFTFITSPDGPNILISDSVSKTLCSSALRAIAGSIRETIEIGSLLEIEVEITAGHTLVPFRGKPASDSVRYKAIGNSLNVADVRWIGEQIAFSQQ